MEASHSPTSSRIEKDAREWGGDRVPDRNRLPVLLHVGNIADRGGVLVGVLYQQPTLETPVGRTLREVPPGHRPGDPDGRVPFLAGGALAGPAHGAIDAYGQTFEALDLRGEVLGTLDMLPDHTAPQGEVTVGKQLLVMGIGVPVCGHVCHADGHFGVVGVLDGYPGRKPPGDRSFRQVPCGIPLSPGFRPGRPGQRERRRRQQCRHHDCAQYRHGRSHPHRDTPSPHLRFVPLPLLRRTCRIPPRRNSRRVRC